MGPVGPGNSAVGLGVGGLRPRTMALPTQCKDSIAAHHIKQAFGCIEKCFF